MSHTPDDLSSLRQQMAEKNARTVVYLTILAIGVLMLWTPLDYSSVPKLAPRFQIQWMAGTLVALILAAVARDSSDIRRQNLALFSWVLVWATIGVVRIPVDSPRVLSCIVGLFVIQWGAGAFLLWRWWWGFGLSCVLLAMGEATILGSEIGGQEQYAAHGLLLMGGVLNVTTTKLRYDTAVSDFRARRALEREKRVAEESLAQATFIDNMKTKFFANVSHELRTPLTMIMAPVAAVHDAIESDLQRDQLDLALRNAKRLERLIDDVLDLSVIDSGGLELEVTEVDLQALVSDLVKTVTPVAHAQQIELRTELHSSRRRIVGDPHRLEIALTNLLSNAIKYTDPLGTIDVLLEEDDSGVRVSIRDTGIGISTDSLDRVFDRFFRADGAVQRGSGAGIGLALTKEIVSLHGGVVDAESTVGVGSTFSFRIPFQPRGLPPPVESSEAESAAHPSTNELPMRLGVAHDTSSQIRLGGQASSCARATIVVAEDQPELREFIGRQLEPNYRVILASDGDDAWRMVKAHDPDLVLSDIMMPGKSGLELCACIRASPKHGQIPVLLLTARTGSDSELKAYTSGANDFIPKPFHPEVLRARVRAHLELHTERALSRDLSGQIGELQQERLQWLGELARFLKHELRTQLAGASLSVELLRECAGRDGSTRYVERIDQALQRMNRLIESATAATSLGRALEVRQMQATDFSEIVHESIEILHGLHSAVSIRTEIEPGVHIEGSSGRLAQMLDKLLSNAIEHVSHRGEIRVSLRDRDGQIVLQIENDGDVLPADKQRIFSPFVSTKMREGPVENLGIGLYVARLIAEAHHGELTASDLAMRQGARFEFVAPSIERKDGIEGRQHAS